MTIKAWPDTRTGTGEVVIKLKIICARWERWATDIAPYQREGWENTAVSHTVLNKQIILSYRGFNNRGKLRLWLPHASIGLAEITWVLFKIKKKLKKLMNIPGSLKYFPRVVAKVSFILFILYCTFSYRMNFPIFTVEERCLTTLWSFAYKRQCQIKNRLHINLLI